MSIKEARVKMWFRVTEEQRRKINVASALVGMNTTDFCAMIMIGASESALHEFEWKEKYGQA